MPLKSNLGHFKPFFLSKVGVGSDQALPPATTNTHHNQALHGWHQWWVSVVGVGAGGGSLRLQWVAVVVRPDTTTTHHLLSLIHHSRHLLWWLAAMGVVVGGGGGGIGSLWLEWVAVVGGAGEKFDFQIFVLIQIS